MRRVLAAAAVGTAVVLAGVLPRAQAAQRVHVVQPGETAYRIARRYGITVDALAAANSLADPARLRVGQRLHIPVPAGGAGEPVAPVVARGAFGDSAASPAPARFLIPRPVAVFAEPRLDSAISAVVDAGSPVALGPRLGRWIQVAPPGAEPGWALAGDLGLAPAPAAPVPERAPPAAETSRPGSALPPPSGSALPPPPGNVLPAQSGSPLPTRPAGRLSSRAEGAAAAARRLVGVPVVWGGTSAQGVDCSGLVWLVYAPLWPGLPRTSFDLFEVGVRVDPGDLRPGDLVFFTTYAPGASHVGIYVGDGAFVHGSASARRVIASPLADPYYAARFLGARRLFP
ncbi:MAG: NlpC/P60 family protein [Armatimonadota bacterium]|nr:NlpC/P60 family protein [Armatimonadota bacterium]MDR7537365.1 NlpC/P60 family protein [Armatimonadota bacterium]